MQKPVSPTSLLGRLWKRFTFGTQFTRSQRNSLAWRCFQRSLGRFYQAIPYYRSEPAEAMAEYRTFEQPTSLPARAVRDLDSGAITFGYSYRLAIQTQTYSVCFWSTKRSLTKALRRLNLKLAWLVENKAVGNNVFELENAVGSVGNEPCCFGLFERYRLNVSVRYVAGEFLLPDDPRCAKALAAGQG